jgi:hypothetical protein
LSESERLLRGSRLLRLDLSRTDEYPDGDANGHVYSHRNQHTHRHPDRHGDAHDDSYADQLTHRHRDRHADRYAHDRPVVDADGHSDGDRHGAGWRGHVHTGPHRDSN